MKKTLLLILTLVLFSGLLSAQNIPDLKGFVNDYAGVLSSSEENQISQILASLEKSTSAQVALLTVNDLQGYNIETFSLKTAEAWGLGQKDRDNGLLLLLAMDEKKVRIEVGYGLEGDITDVKSGYIIRNIIIPEFKKGDFAEGLFKGVSAINGIITNTSDISDKELREYETQPVSSRSSGIPLQFIVFIIIFLLSSISRGRRRGHGGLFNALLWGSILSSGSRHRGRGGFGGGFGGGGFGGGGGFSGGGGGFSGGGGGFGGGGASGGW